MFLKKIFWFIFSGFLGLFPSISLVETSIAAAVPPENAQEMFPENNAVISLQQKIGQMLMVGFCKTKLRPQDPIVQDILAQRIGGVVLYARYMQTKGVCNIENPQQLKFLTRQLQTYAWEAAQRHHNHFYPLFIAVDYEGGKVVNLKEENGFPASLSAAEVGKSSDEQAWRSYNQIAEILRKEGLNLDFAPVVDVNTNPNNPIIAKYGRSFSNDPMRVIHFASIFSQAFYDHHILCTFKHFPGHGSSTEDSHLGFVDVTRTWQSLELLPYQYLLNEPHHCDLVMTAHVTQNHLDKVGYPASLSYSMITGLLRKQLGFKGVVITDDLQMGAIQEHYNLPAITQLAINAGADILIFSNQLVKPQNTAELLRVISQEVKEGKISRNRINESYQRIIKLKQTLSPQSRQSH